MNTPSRAAPRRNNSALTLQVAPLDSEPGRPTVKIIAGELPRMVDDAEAALLATPDHGGLYQRGGMIVSVIRLEAPQGGIIRRAVGTPIISPVETASLVEILTSAATFQKFDGRAHEWLPKDCPSQVAITYGSRRGRWNLRPLTGVIDAPTLREDGSILNAPGYDECTGLLFVTDRTWPTIPESPDREDALEAINVLSAPFAKFPFVETADKSVLLAAILTALIRRSLRSAPLFGFDANTAGTGKSLLADSVARIASGRDAAAMSQGTDQEEDRKKIFAALLAGDGVLLIDNVERPIEGATLCSMLTQAEIKDRVLGISKNVVASTAVLMMASGNNLTFRGDMRTRALTCRLDAEIERPEERQFTGDLRVELSARRGELVTSGLTILRAYIAAGKPRQAVTPFGRFEQFSDLVRSTLVWLGAGDCCEVRKRIERNDDSTLHLAAMLHAWDGAFGSRPETVRVAMQEPGDELLAAMKDVASDRIGEVNAKRLGHWLHGMEGRIQRGRKFQRGPTVSDRITWKVATA